ncbi:MAG: hypothetical protein EOO71_39910 [Myxococcaceae bacterium]|nr:MAG: hypothetical protein EOO71_39910 [Myxococcaceae bacterium]
MNTNRRGALSALVVAMALAFLPACDPDAEQPDTGPGKVTGQVTLDDGAPPEGIEVLLNGTQVAADAQGAFTFDGVTPGTYVLTGIKAGYEGPSLVVVVKPAETTTVSVTLKLVRSQVSGTITLEGATSHEGITVSLKDTAFTTTTNAQGAFVLEGVATGVYTLVASKEGYETGEVLAIVTGEPEAVNLTLGRPTGSIGGSITLEGAASNEGVTVTLTGTSFTAQSDEYGIFVMIQVPPGTYSAVASKAGYVSVTQEVTVKAGETAVPSFTLKAGAGLLGLESVAAH